MRKRRFRYLIAFVAAMFIANNAAASVYACLAGLGSVVAIATTQSHPAAMAHMEHAADADALCLTQCIQSYRESAQEFAANGWDNVSLPVAPDPPPALRAEPTRTRIVWAPKATAPKLFLLFGNLRN